MKRTVAIEDHEEWESAIDGVVWVRKLDSRGNDVEEQVKGHGKLRILPEERRFNQERAAEANLDPFQNGMLVPVKLVDDSEPELKGNPNHLTAVDMDSLLDHDAAKLTTELSGVTNAMTLQRLLSIATGPDSDATIKQVRAIEARIDELLHPVEDDPREVVEIETIGGGGTAFATRARKNPAPANPAMGRRVTR